MFKQSSIAALQQQLAHLEILRGDQLNGLLKRLESQKANLPIEDHPIIDWGISLIRAKIREEEQVMSKAWRGIEALYKQNHRDFVKQVGWEPYDKDRFRAAVKKSIQDITVAAYTSNKPEWARRYAQKLKVRLNAFCNEESIVYKELIDGCESFCLKRAERLSNSETEDYDPLHADCYRMFAKGLKE